MRKLTCITTCVVSVALFGACKHDRIVEEPIPTLSANPLVQIRGNKIVIVTNEELTFHRLQNPPHYLKSNNIDYLDTLFSDIKDALIVLRIKLEEDPRYNYKGTAVYAKNAPNINWQYTGGRAWICLYYRDDSNPLSSLLYVHEDYFIVEKSEQ